MMESNRMINYWSSVIVSLINFIYTFYIQLIISCLAIILFSACSNRIESESTLKDYTLKEENGLIKVKEINPVSVKVIYRPTDLLVAQHLRNQKVSDKVVDSLRNHYELFVYFILSLSANGREIEAWNSNSHNQFSERLQTLAFGMKEYVQLVTNQQDTLPIADYAYQRTFGAGTSSDLLFAFNKKELEHTDWVQFRLKDFGLGIGNNQFRFRTKDILNAPHLHFDKQLLIADKSNLTLK